MSSSVTSSGRSAAAWARKRPTASNSRIRSPSGVMPPVPPGRGARGSAAAASWSRLPPSARSTWIHGQYGGAPPSSQQRPLATARPPLGGGMSQLSDQPSLADAGLAGDQHQRSGAGAGGVDRDREVGQLAGASHERPRCGLPPGRGFHRLRADAVHPVNVASRTKPCRRSNTEAPCSPSSVSVPGSDSTRSPPKRSAIGAVGVSRLTRSRSARADLSSSRGRGSGLGSHCC